MWRIAPRLMVLAAVFCAGTAFGDQPFFMGLGDLPGANFYSAAYAVSADGKVIAGVSSSAIGGQAFRWTAESGMVGLGDLPGGQFSSWASALSADGSVVVGISRSASGDEAFRWTADEGMLGLGDLPGSSFFSNALGVSADGAIIVGGSNGTDGGVFRWTAEEGMVGLGLGSAEAISADGTVIVGFTQAGLPGSSDNQAFRWKDGIMTGLGDFPGGELDSSAAAVSANGEVIVGYGVSAQGAEAFRWTESDGLVGLGDLPGGQFYSAARSISADGLIITGSSRTDAIHHNEEAFVWDESRGMRRLADALLADHGLAVPGWTLTSASVSADGSTFVGWGFNPDGNIEAFVAHIPEPTTLVLVLLGAWRGFRRPQLRGLSG